MSKLILSFAEFFDAIVADELNVKNVTFTQDVRDFTSYSFKPQLKTVGPKYGKHVRGNQKCTHADWMEMLLWMN